ncbi:MAG: permease-like cell division protein FtsX [Tissierellia bacterium]|nr:permease-like cell division protein FtsX [Tissierellia bacterium]
MRLIRQIFSNIKEAFQGIFRNFGMGVLSIISISSVLLFFGIVLLFVLNMTGIVRNTEAKVDSVVVYLTDTATTEDIQSIITKGENTGMVQDVSFTSKEQALKNFNDKLNLSGKEYLTEGLEENPLPASLTFHLNDLRDAEALASHLQSEPGVYQIGYLSDLITRVMEVNRWVKILGIGGIAILLLLAIVLINNTVKATVVNRSNELQIMKYIGATNGYIQRPLLLEGLILGLVASLLALVAIYFGYHFIFSSLVERMETLFQMELLRPADIVHDFAIIFVSIGVGVGLLGSSLSIQRYLNV